MKNERENGIVLIGGGGHCRSVLDALKKLRLYTDVYVTDVSLPQGSRVDGALVVGDDGVLEEVFQRGITRAFVTVGSIESTAMRREAYMRAVEIGFDFPSIIDPEASVASSAIVGAGTFVGKGAIVNAGAVVGSMCIVNTCAVVEHDCTIDDFTHISVGAVLCGGVKVGKDAFVGANATLIQGVSVGAESLIGAGSVVLSDVPCGERALGVFAGT